MKTFKVKNDPPEKSLCGNFLVCLTFLAFTVITVEFFAPDAKTNAETVEQTTGPYVLSMSTESEIGINVTPTSEQAVYTATDNLSITNSCGAGSTITLTTHSNDSNDLVRTGSDTGKKEIEATSLGSLSDNSWGFSVDNGSTYSAVPKLSQTAAIIYDSSKAQVAALTIPVVYGVKADATLPSGAYTNDVVYSITPKPGCLEYAVNWDLDGGTAKEGATYPTSLNWEEELDLSELTPTGEGIFIGWTNGVDEFSKTETAANINPNNLTSITLTAIWARPMQSFSCSNVTTMEKNIYLYDTRDNNVYTAKKLADGRCWMTQNLRIINKTISSTDSNLPDGETWVIPASSISGFNANNVNNAYVDLDYGGYYSFYTATAGWGTADATSGSSPKDICPKGWRLPIGGADGEFQTLYDKYKSHELMRGEPGITLSGYIYDGSAVNRGSYSRTWSSTARNADYAHYLALNDSGGVNPADNNRKSAGYSVRCIADKSINDITYMQDITPNIVAATATGASATLTDKRDSEKYIVKKLKDNRVWMAQDLRIINKTITSEDSNIPDGEESVALLAARKSGNSYIYPRGIGLALVSSDNNGYYDASAATAGWYRNSEQAGAIAPKDICPKWWQLPTSVNANSDYAKLYEKYNTVESLMDEPSFRLGGYLHMNYYEGYSTDDFILSLGYEGNYMSSVMTDPNYNGAFFINKDGTVELNHKATTAGGISVRCIVKK